MKKRKEKPNALEYIHKDSLGDIKTMREISNGIKSKLTEFYNEGRIEGVEFLFVKNKEKLDANYVLKDLSTVTSDTYPFIYIAVQHFESEDLEISNWLENSSFIKVE